MKTLAQEKTIIYRNQLVTFVDWSSHDIHKGTIEIKILGRKTFMTVDYNDLQNTTK